MKTLKFALIAVIVACTMISIASTDGFKSKPTKSVKMTLSAALKEPALVVDMREQIDRSFLNRIEQLYIVEVRHNSAVYSILGSRQDWIRFFRGPIPEVWQRAKARTAIPIDE